MLDEVLEQSWTQAERCSPMVRAAARMRIARVQAARDSVRARMNFELALEEIRGFSERERQILFDQARMVAAAIAPDLLGEIPEGGGIPGHRQAESVLRVMIEHGHLAAAFDYVVHCDTASEFPFGCAANLMRRIDDERRLAVMSCAVEAWRLARGDGESQRFGRLQMKFIELFQRHWRVLPRDESVALVREIVRSELDRPEASLSAQYPGFEITSSREQALFEVLHILRDLDPALAESLIAGHGQLAVAAGRYPNGIQTMHQEFERQAANAKETCSSGGFIMAGDPGDFDRQKRLLQATQQGDFGPSIDYALELYSEDVDADDPNQALKAFWPSTCSARTTLYQAGQRLGAEAVRLLERIPDPDLRLFARIELAAALAGLPAARETSMERRRPAD